MMTWRQTVSSGKSGATNTTRTRKTYHILDLRMTRDDKKSQSAELHIRKAGLTWPSLHTCKNQTILGKQPENMEGERTCIISNFRTGENEQRSVPIKKIDLHQAECGRIGSEITTRGELYA